MKTLFDHEKATIQFNEHVNSIELHWKKKQDPDTYRLLFNNVLKYLKEHNATGFLSDIRKEGIVHPESSVWVQTEIMPAAFAAGLKKIAVVMDSDVFKEFYVKNIEKAAGSDRMKYFDSEETANNWLLEK